MPSMPDPDLQGSVILIIDDNPINLKVASDCLEDAGLIVLVAQDGDCGITRARYAQPQLILLDALMPKANGFEVCQRLKADPNLESIPVIFMTILSDTEDKVKGFQAGAIDFITKPIQREELLARVSTHLRIQLLTRQLQQQNENLQQQALELKSAKETAELANRELEKLSYVDSLTQIANRRRFDDYLEQEWARSTLQLEPLSLILCDIDHFKRYNDDYGHQAGDLCLRQVAQTLKQTVVRSGDLVTRYGGEEFVILLPNTTLNMACQIAESMRIAIEQLQIPHAQSPVNTVVTISLGISSRIPTDDHRPEHLFAEADQALYRAKAEGRNRSCQFVL